MHRSNEPRSPFLDEPHSEPAEPPAEQPLLVEVDDAGEWETHIFDRIFVRAGPPPSHHKWEADQRIGLEVKLLDLETHRFLSTPPDVQLYSPRSSSLTLSDDGWSALNSLNWPHNVLPRFGTCTCSTGTGARVPLPPTAEGEVEKRKWEVRYAAQVRVVERVEEEEGGKKGKGKGRMWGGAAKAQRERTKERFFLIPFTYSPGSTPSSSQLLRVPPEYLPLDLRAEADAKTKRWSPSLAKKKQEAVQLTLVEDGYESAAAEDWTIQDLSLHARVLTPSTTSPAKIAYTVRLSFGTRVYPAASRFIYNLQALVKASTSSVTAAEASFQAPFRTTLVLEERTTVVATDPVRPLVQTVMQDVRQLPLRLGSGITAAQHEQVYDDRPSVKSCSRLADDNGLSRGARAEEVFLEWKGVVEVPGQQRKGEVVFEWELPERARGCRVEKRYDLVASISLPSLPSFAFSEHHLAATNPSAALSDIPLVVRIPDIRVDLPAPPSSPTPAAGASSSSTAPARGGGVEVDAERYPTLAALYGGTRAGSSRGGGGGSAREWRDGAAPPAYGVEDALAAPPPSALDFKADPPRAAGTVEPAPPSYPGPSSSSSFASFAPLSPPPPVEPASEAPPSWDETVRDDMIDDWVAASAVFGLDEEEEEGRTRTS
ncbi:hypothetical protein JCM8097_001490 [Rhodosporidiobolus ruineniae]